MIPDDYTELIDELTRRTLEGRVLWKPTLNQREYLVYFDQFTLSLRDGSDDEDNAYITVTLKDKAGKNIDYFTVWSGDADWAKVSDLHQASRRKALNIDGAIKSIVTELRTKTAIGMKVPKTEDEDEVL